MAIQRFEALVTAVMDDAPDFHTRQEVMIEAAECDHNIAYPARIDIEKIARNLEGLAEENARHRQELALAKYYVRTENFDVAVAHAKRALPLPYTGAYVRNSPAFRPLMSSPGHKRDFIVASFNVPVPQGVDSCRKLEF